MVAETMEREPSLLPLLDEGKPTSSEMLPRRIAMGAIGLLVLALPHVLSPTGIQKAAVYVIVGLSLNILIGHAGQVSLGHQAFVGVGAFTSALTVANGGLPFFVGVLVSVVTGAIAAFLLGLVALRLKGLYLALLTLAYGHVAETVIFGLPFVAGGVQAPRPPGFETNETAYVYLIYVVVGLVLLLDWRLMRSKAGRAILAIRENEIAAASFGINVVMYKLLAFMISGGIAGAAGALFGHASRQVVSTTFNFELALVFVLMTVVGGLGSRAGIFIGAMFFALLPELLEFVSELFNLHWSAALLVNLQLIIGPILLIATLTLAPGGIGQQIRPITEWLRGQPFSLKHGHDAGVQSGGAGVRP